MTEMTEMLKLHLHRQQWASYFVFDGNGNLKKKENLDRHDQLA